MDCHIIIGFILGLIGSLFGAFFAHLFSECRRRKQEFNNAATKFTNAFIPVITFLKHNANVGNIGSTDDLSDVLLFGYVHHHLKALEVFKNHLSVAENAGVDKAWKDYCCCKENPEMLFFEQYFTGGRPKAETETKKVLALERIEKILKFAEHK